MRRLQPQSALQTPYGDWRNAEIGDIGSESKPGNLEVTIKAKSGGAASPPGRVELSTSSESEPRSIEEGDHVM
jgi:hypothetical protein